MRNKIIKKLAEVSYSHDLLDGEKIGKIAEHLNRKELREYIKALKEQEKIRTVFIDMPNEADDQEKKEFQELFSRKRIEFRKNPALLLGIRIIENDIVYNLNLNNSLKQIVNYLESQI